MHEGRESRTGPRLPVWAAALSVVVLAFAVGLGAAQGLRDRPLFPKRPAPLTKVRVANVKGLSYTLSGVPEYEWHYGCSPTAAGMVIGWWDTQTGCGSLFDGSAATWSGNTNAHTMVASAAHIAAGQALGLTYGSYKNHVADCLADFLCTHDSGTDRDKIGPGLVNFCAWAGPSAYKNTAYTATATTYYEFNGWSYDDYCAEIDAGRPVHLGLTSSAGGHSVVGIGYDKTGSKQNYICWTTWPNWGTRSWGWTGESESGYNFYVYAATYLRVTPKASSGPPTAPTSVTVSPASPVTTEDLTASASGSTDPNGDTITYEYQWSKSTDGGTTWGGWDWSGATLGNASTTKSEKWRARARASAGGETSDWVTSTAVTIANSSPTAPTSVAITPTSPVTTDDLAVTASGASDADSDTLTYECQWSRSTDGGTTWSGWDWAGATLSGSVTAKGEQWRVQARVSDGTTTSGWTVGTAVTIGNSAPSAPSAVGLTPASPVTTDDLVAAGSGATDADGDALTYEYQWSKSTDAGVTWSAWSWSGATLSNTLTTKGEQWRARGRASDGTATGDWTTGSAVTIGNSAPTTPTSASITQASPLTLDDLTGEAGGSTDADGDTITYEYQWTQSTDGGVTWSAWKWSGGTLSNSLTTVGDQWKVRACASDGTTTSGYRVSAATTVGNTAPSAPTTVALTPASPATTDDLAAAASGSSDADGDTLTCEYQWSRSTDGGSTWSAWSWTGATVSGSLTARGEQWRAQARVSDGTAASDWTVSAAVTIGNSAPSAPSAMGVTPASPVTTDDLVAAGSGATDADGDALTYEYEWSKSTDAGVTWSAWGWSGATLSNALTARGEQWRARGRGNDGTTTGDWTTGSAVTVGNSAPTTPTSASVTPASPLTLDDLTGEAGGSTDADGDTITYEYQWTQSTDGGVTWSAWKWSGGTLSNTLTTVGDQWKVRACASDGTTTSGYRVSTATTVGNTAPSAPTTVALTPASPATTDNLAATASGASDADGDTLTCEYQWSKSTDGGSTWSAWSWTGATLSGSLTAKGEQWRAQARASDGTATSSWTISSAAVTIGNSAPSAPSTVGVTPASPVTTDDLVAAGSGASDADGDALTYEYEWSKSTDAGVTWSAWSWSGATLSNALTTRGEQWRARGRANDGTAGGAWTTGSAVTVGNSAPTTPSSANITPASPLTLDSLTGQAGGSSDADGDTITYEYQWTQSTDGGVTWSAWKWSGGTLSNTLTTVGDQWKVRACASDGTTTSAYRVSTATAVGNTAPSAPTTVALTPASPATADSLAAAASGASDADGDTLTCEYQWSKSTDGGSTWSAWSWTGAALSSSLTARGEQWRAQARVSDGTATSGWTVSAAVSIGNTAPSAPSAVGVTPASPVTTDDLVAAGSGATDADGEALTYEYQWSKSTDAGVTWSAWSWSGATLSNAVTTRGEQWRARGRASDGTATGAWTAGAAVTVANTAPTSPASASITPASPLTLDDLVAAASGASDADGDTITYEYQWTQSTDGGVTWSAWKWAGGMLSNTLTTVGDQWKVRACASDGTTTSGYRASAAVTVANTVPSGLASVVIGPASPLTTDDLTVAGSGSSDADGGTLSYEYQWSKSTDGGTTWSGWNWSGATLPNALTAKGEQWRARGRASDGAAAGAWTSSTAVTIANSAPTSPVSAGIAPASPVTLDDLTGAATGATDADGDALSYEYEWSRSTDGGTTWSAWSWLGATLGNAATSRGEQWRVRARAGDGTTTGGYCVSATVTVADTAPTAPTSVAITPTSPLTTDGLSAAAEGSSDADGGTLTYEYQWSRSVDGGATWSGWDWTGAALASSLTARGEQWRVAGRASDGTATSGWTIGSAVVTIGNSLPSAPSAVSVAPASPVTTDDLTAAGSGATDADSDGLSYEYQWSRSTDGGATWSAWDWSGATLASALTTKGEQWRVRTRASDGTASGGWTVGAAVTIANSAPTVPASTGLAPTSPVTLDDLIGSAGGATDADGDAVTYEYQWTRSTDGGVTWCAWKWPGATLGNTLTGRGEQWKVRARASDGTATSAYRVSAAATISNTAPAVPASIAVSPARPLTASDLSVLARGSSDADGDTVTYAYRWSKSTDGGSTWSDWNWTGATLSSSLTARGEQWRASARASDGTATSAWVACSSAVTVGNSTPSAPSTVSFTPTAPLTTASLKAASSGATDADGDALVYQYQWSRSTDGGETWSAWRWSGATLGPALTTKGELWRVRARANDGTATGNWTTGAAVTIANSAPTPPVSANITPGTPAALDDLVGSATGSTDADGDAVAYQYQWARSSDGGATWSAWKWSGARLSGARTAPGELWKVRACANDGATTSKYRVSAAVTIGPSKKGLAEPASGPALAVSAAVGGMQGRTRAITVSLSAAAEVEATVQNLAGRTVAVLPSRRLAPGITTVYWSGRSSSGTLVPAGPYLLRLRARGAGGNCGTCLVWLTE